MKETVTVENNIWDEILDRQYQSWLERRKRGIYAKGALHKIMLADPRLIIACLNKQKDRHETKDGLLWQLDLFVTLYEKVMDDKTAMDPTDKTNQAIAGNIMEQLYALAEEKMVAYAQNYNPYDLLSYVPPFEYVKTNNLNLVDRNYPFRAPAYDAWRKYK